MNREFLDQLIVALFVLGAALYLYRALKPNNSAHTACGCGSQGCALPKPLKSKKRSDQDH
jgi:hypothetical protein